MTQFPLRVLKDIDEGMDRLRVPPPRYRCEEYRRIQVSNFDVLRLAFRK
jgi:hypothetical protein